MLIILIRYPKDVILSNFLFNTNQKKLELASKLKKRTIDYEIEILFDRLIDELVQYYEEIIKNIDKNFIILNFDDFVKETNLTIEKICNFYNLKNEKINVKEILDVMEARDKINTYNNGTFENNGHVPRKKSKDFDLIKFYQNTTSFNEKLKYVNNLYFTILKKCL